MVKNAGDHSSIPGWGRSPWEEIGYPLQYSWASLMAQLVKNLPAMWDMWVQSLGWKDALEKGNATLSVFWPGEFHGLYILRHDWENLTFTFTVIIAVAEILKYHGSDIVSQCFTYKTYIISMRTLWPWFYFCPCFIHEENGGP